MSGGAGGERHRGGARRALLWLPPALLLAVALLGLALLPGFVASNYHRATLEALAGSLTGQRVHIGGTVSLALLPHPRFVAGSVTITGQDRETITAASLTLDLAPLPLLRGQVLARSITLQSPHIALPWPLPGGAAAIAPPRWLAALHAEIGDGAISLGEARFTHVQADIFTGGGGAFSISGSGELLGTPVAISLALGPLSAVGAAPLSLDVAEPAAGLRAHVSGSYDSASTLSGNASFAAGAEPGQALRALPIAGTAAIAADPGQIQFAGLSLRQGEATLDGSATLDLAGPSLSLLLSGRDLIVPAQAAWRGAGAIGARLPVRLSLDASNTRLASDGGDAIVPRLLATIGLGAAGAEITSLDAELPGDSSLWLAGRLSTAGALQAKTVFETSRLQDFLGGFGAAGRLPSGWQQLRLTGDVEGTADRLKFAGITGELGVSRIAGNAVLLRRSSLAGTLHFDQLDLTPFAALPGAGQVGAGQPGGSGGSDAVTPVADFEISADRADLGAVALSHLLIDAAFGERLVIRHATAGIYGGIAAADLTLSPGTGQTGVFGTARAMLALPSGQPAAQLLPVWLRPPDSLARPPLALAFAAGGTAARLATSADLRLGNVSITAAPVLDLTRRTAQGALTLRHPDAIAALKAFGLDAGLAWPGAGSLALRANMLLSPTRMGLTDFVLSLGDLAGGGQLIYGTDHRLNGDLAFATLALPALSSRLALPFADLAGLQGEIGLAAGRILWGGGEILGPSQAELVFRPAGVTVSIERAALGDGVLRGSLSVGPVDAAPPAIAARLALDGATLSALALPAGFPIGLAASAAGGRIDATAELTASGYAPQAWLATLAGNAALAAQAGRLEGFDLPAATVALGAKSRRAARLRAACLSGTTDFTRLDVTGSLASGIYGLTGASLESPAGQATATGSVDLPDRGLNLAITLLPQVPAPPALSLRIAGDWAAPRRGAGVKLGLAWKPAGATAP